jgi:hypothetical protein
MLGPYDTEFIRWREQDLERAAVRAVRARSLNRRPSPGRTARGLAAAAAALRWTADRLDTRNDAFVSAAPARETPSPC